VCSQKGFENGPSATFKKQKSRLEAKAAFVGERLQVPTA
jgi:hypothetical protein